MAIPTPIAVWRLADGKRRIATDEVGEHFGLYRSGASGTGTDGVGGDGNACGNFDGKNGCLTVRHHDDFLLGGGTVSLWCRPASRRATQGLLSKDASGFGSGGHLTLSLQDSRVVARLQSRKASFEVRSETIPLRHWSHIAFCFGPGGMQLYVNGNRVGSADFEGGLADNHEPLAIAASTMQSESGKSHPLNDYFHGSLDEIAIFSRSLDASQVGMLFVASRPRYRSLAHAYAMHNPAAWWRLAEKDGSTADDEAGDQHGHYHAHGVRFDGDDYVDVGAIDVDCGSFTILACFKAAGFSVPDARIISKATGLPPEDHYWMIGTTLVNDRPRLRFRLQTEAGVRDVTAKDHEIPYDKWVFVAAVYDGKRMTLYQDGKIVASFPHHGRPKTNSHCRVWIGDSPSGKGSRPFEGDIRDAAIFHDALSSASIEAIFAAAEDKDEPAVEATDLPSPAETTDPTPRTSPSHSDLSPIPPAIVIPPLPPLGTCPHCGGLHLHAPVIRVQPRPLTGLHWHCDL